MRFLKSLAAAVAVSALLAAASPAAAKLMQAELNGSFVFGRDDTGALNITNYPYWARFTMFLVYDTANATAALDYGPGALQLTDPFLSASLAAVKPNVHYRAVAGPEDIFGSIDLLPAPGTGRVVLTPTNFAVELHLEDQIVVPGFDGGRTLDRRHDVSFNFPLEITSFDQEGDFYPSSYINQGTEHYFAAIAETAPENGVYINPQSYYHIGIGGNARINFVRFTEYHSETAVPEPATWALMLVGFGSAGAALRRRRVAPAR